VPIRRVRATVVWSFRMHSPTDAELDAYILTRLRLIGVDLSALPEDDASAPADQRRILASARTLLRNTVPVISAFTMDVQEVPPMLYPAGFTSWQR
jgi:hypothetical protein